jgi:multiple sugar transport system substrate-binding protein
MSNRTAAEPSRRSISPEGPYETQDANPARFSAHRDAGDFLELYEALQRDAAQLLRLSPGQREVRIITHLVRSHLAGRLVTSSSLAAASGLSYGTAIRTIARMEGEGLITRRIC